MGTLRVWRVLLCISRRTVDKNLRWWEGSGKGKVVQDLRQVVEDLGLVLVGGGGETRDIPPMASARVQRWALMLSAYGYNISGAFHANADGLSRLPVANTISEVPLPGDVLLVFRTLESTLITTSQNRHLSCVRSNILSSWIKSDDSELQPYQTRPLELSIQDGCVLWGSRVITPKKGREAVIALLHEQYPGITRIKDWQGGTSGGPG